jgi:hypothetical protein
MRTRSYPHWPGFPSGEEYPLELLEGETDFLLIALDNPAIPRDRQWSALREKLLQFRCNWDGPGKQLRPHPSRTIN